MIRRIIAFGVLFSLFCVNEYSAVMANGNGDYDRIVINELPIEDSEELDFMYSLESIEGLGPTIHNIDALPVMYFESIEDLVPSTNNTDALQNSSRSRSDYAATGCYLKIKMPKHVEKKSCPCEHPGCNYIATTCGNLKIHMRKHTGEKPYVCEHPGCNYASTMQSAVKRHMRKHTGEKPYACKYSGCNYASSNSGALKKHMLIHTKKQQTYMCLECNRFFFRKQDFQKHSIHKHGNIDHEEPASKRRKTS